MIEEEYKPVDQVDRLLRVVVTMATETNGWEMLAPGYVEGKHPIVDGCEIILNPQEEMKADFWIVFANARPRDEMHCAPENTLFIAAEPEEKKVYPKAFYAQFHRIIDTHRKSGHPRLLMHSPCLSWHVGLDHESHSFQIGYNELVKMDCPAGVENKVSVVCSDAAFTSGQRERLEFLTGLKERLGDRLVHFGRGFRPVADKLEAIRGYRFHLVMENCRVPHYWTEKISDAYLGWSFPLYVGSPNLSEYFPEKSFIQLDIDDPEKAAEKISALLASPREDEEIAAIKKSRSLVLGKYNPWSAWARWASEFHDPYARTGRTVIRSHKAFRPFPRGLLYRLRSF